MFVSMQENWTISVKSKEAIPNSRFIITGAVSGNGTYSGGVGFSVNVAGDHWSISIQNDQTGSFRASYTRIKFPTLTGGNYVFDIESNSDNVDVDPIFDDLILTCSTPATIEDNIIYGHVKSYSGLCIYNPCYPSHLVIDTPAALATALKNPAIKGALKTLYPDRVIPPVMVNPNPPDSPQFTPMMINVLNPQQIPVKSGSIFRKKTPQSDVPKKASESAQTSSESAIRIDSLSFEKNVALSSTAMDMGNKYTYDKVALASILDEQRLYFCSTEDVIFETLNFQEYDRTASELAGGPYTGKGNRLNLGYAMTDMNGNYIFRFKQTLPELVNEVLIDVPAGGDALVESHPDVIVRINDPSSGSVLFESAPYFNIPNIKRINLCFPESVLNNTQVCTTKGAHLIEGIGKVAIGGPQNTTFLPKARTTALNMNILGEDGKITAHDNAGPGPVIDCGCWVDWLDLRGCINDVNVAWYTIRYTKTPDVSDSWAFVTQEYHHLRFSNPNSNSPGTKVGPFLATLKVPVVSGPPVIKSEVIAFKNIQKEILSLGGGDWYYANIDILAQLQSSIYEAGSPGTVYFRVDAYDSSGNPLNSDMISLYIDNSDVVRALPDAYFDTTVSDQCVLFSLTDDEINAPLPLTVWFKANHLNGFLSHYNLYMGKGKYNCEFPTSDDPLGLAHGVYNPSADPKCIGYIGTANNAAGSLGLVNVKLTPIPGAAVTIGGVTCGPYSGKWLETGQDFCTFAVNLTWQKRCTNGYDLYTGVGPIQFIFGLKRKGT